MGAQTRVVIGSEIHDDRHVDLDSTAGKILVPVAIYDASGNQITKFAGSNAVNATLSAETTKVIGTIRQLGNIGAVLDGVNTAATAPANGILGLGIYNSTEPSPSTGQSAGIQLDSKGRQRMVIMDATGNTRGANVDANNNMQVILALNTGVDIGKLTANQSINLAQVAGGTTITGGITGSVATGGNIAHGSSNTGANPDYAGGEAIAHGTNPTAVTAGQRTKLYANRAGIQFVIAGHPNMVTFEAAYTAAQTDTAIVTVGAGTKIIVTQIAALCDNANTVNTSIRIGFGPATTPTTTGVVLTHPNIAPGSGFSRGDGSGILGIGADNDDLRVTCTVPTGGSVRVLVSYYTIES